MKREQLVTSVAGGMLVGPTRLENWTSWGLLPLAPTPTAAWHSTPASQPSLIKPLNSSSSCMRSRSWALSNGPPDSRVAELAASAEFADYLMTKKCSTSSAVVRD